VHHQGTGKLRVAKLRVFCELKCQPAHDWSAIFRTTRSLPGVNSIMPNRNFRTDNKTCILAHTTCVYAMYTTITVVINVTKEPVNHQCRKRWTQYSCDLGTCKIHRTKVVNSRMLAYQTEHSCSWRARGIHDVHGVRRCVTE